MQRKNHADSVCRIDSVRQKAYDKRGMHITLLKGAFTMDADPYSKTMNHLTGSGGENVRRLSA